MFSIKMEPTQRNTNATPQVLDPSTKIYFSRGIEKVLPELKKHRKETGETIDKGLELKG